MDSTFGKRLEELRASLNFTQADLAAVLGVPHTTISKYENNLNKPGFDVLSKLGKLKNVNLKWLLTGDEEALITTEGSHKRESFYTIPMLADSASAGNGNYIYEKRVENYFCLPKTLVNNELFRQASDLSALVVAGDSMEPTFLNGDIIIIDSSVINLREGRVYVIRIDNDLVVKRIQLTGRGEYRLISDNTVLYPAFTLSIKEMVVVGQVVAYFRNLYPLTNELNGGPFASI